jgi:hypothetical protein
VESDNSDLELEKVANGLALEQISAAAIQMSALDGVGCRRERLEILLCEL